MSDPSSSPGGNDTATLSRATVVVSALATAALAFVVGFGLAVSGGDDGGEVAVEAVTTTVPPTTSVPPTSAPPPETTAVPVTDPPETTPSPTAPPPTVTATTSAPVVVTEPPSTLAPAQLTAQYPHDSADRLVMNKGGTATLTITNVGGSLGQWLVQASGYVFVEGVANGTIQPGQSVQVRLRGAPEVPPISPQGSVTVSGGSGNQITISVLVL